MVIRVGYLGQWYQSLCRGYIHPITFRVFWYLFSNCSFNFHPTQQNKSWTAWNIVLLCSVEYFMRGGYIFIETHHIISHYSQTLSWFIIYQKIWLSFCWVNCLEMFKWILLYWSLLLGALVTYIILSGESLLTPVLSDISWVVSVTFIQTVICPNITALISLDIFFVINCIHFYKKKPHKITLLTDSLFVYYLSIILDALLLSSLIQKN